jgi:formylmethanofuran dehydrogenase subunit C
MWMAFFSKPRDSAPAITIVVRGSVHGGLDVHGANITVYGAVHSSTGDVLIGGSVTGDANTVNGNLTCGNVRGRATSMNGDVRTGNENTSTTVATRESGRTADLRLISRL